MGYDRRPRYEVRQTSLAFVNRSRPPAAVLGAIALVYTRKQDRASAHQIRPSNGCASANRRSYLCYSNAGGKSDWVE